MGALRAPSRRSVAPPSAGPEQARQAVTARVPAPSLRCGFARAGPCQGNRGPGPAHVRTKFSRLVWRSLPVRMAEGDQARRFARVRIGNPDLDRRFVQVGDADRDRVCRLRHVRGGDPARGRRSAHAGTAAGDEEAWSTRVRTGLRDGSRAPWLTRPAQRSAGAEVAPAGMGMWISAALKTATRRPFRAWAIRWPGGASTMRRAQRQRPMRWAATWRRCPEGLPAAAQGVLVLGEELVELLEEFG